MIAIGSRQRTQPPPPRVVFEALCEPDQDPCRPWLSVNLLEDEQLPSVLRSDFPTSVVWSSLWIKRPEAVVEFDLAPRGSDTMLRWTVYVDEPAPPDAWIGHVRKRMNRLINADLRFTFGQ